MSSQLATITYPGNTQRVYVKFSNCDKLSSERDIYGIIEMFSSSDEVHIFSALFLEHTFLPCMNIWL